MKFSSQVHKYVLLLSAEFCFLLGMWLSKTAWPLWVAESGDIRVYGISYSAMALTGALSLSIGKFVSKLGATRSLRLGVLLYGAGVGLRWLDQSVVAGVLSGVLGGVGASTLLLSFRTLSRRAQGELPSPRFIAMRRALADIAAGAAGLCIAGLISVWGFRAAVFAAWIPLLSVLILSFIWSIEAPESVEAQTTKAPPPHSTSKSSMMELWSRPKWRSLVCLSALGGLYSSLITPYFPMLFKEIGLAPESIALLATVATLTSLLSQPVGAWLSRRVKPLSSFVASELVFILAVGVLMTAHSGAWVPLWVGVRALGRTVSLLSEEILEFSAVSQSEAALYYGAIQTAFLLGDSAGGVLGGLTISHFGVKSTMTIALLLAICHVGGMFISFSERKLSLNTSEAL